MTTTKPTTKPTENPPILQPGWGVAIILRQPVNELACYAGEVQAVDGRGVRISAMDWAIGLCVGMDWWFPWADIAAMEVCTDHHSGWDPGRTQSRANRAAGLSREEEA
ncbi:MAG TPA: hypothetical protein VGF51_07660 [Acidimicrobiales bacterium]